MAWKNNITIKASAPNNDLNNAIFPSFPLQTEDSQVTFKEKNEQSSSPTSSGKGIIEIIIMKKTVIHVYPDGQTHIQKHLCQEWIAGMGQVYKQKAKAKQEKKKDLEDIKIVEGESY